MRQTKAMLIEEQANLIRQALWSANYDLRLLRQANVNSRLNNGKDPYYEPQVRYAATMSSVWVLKDVRPVEYQSICNEALFLLRTHGQKV